MENVFEQFQRKKKELRELCQQALNYGWITEADARAMTEKLDNDVLTIGVIGQMKAGKSTFLNAFVFGRDVLPAATTPMTAALSVITYGEKEEVVAEFYSAEEWTEQKMMAQRNVSEAGSELEKSKIQAAQELVAKSLALGGELTSLLGQSKRDSLENLIQYVGADGKYVSITKAVTIYYPQEYLKGVEIVDTPGFNDPIVSREERTKDFLMRADAVLMMLYAGRPFDATDHTIVFKHVARCGIGKLIIGVNKYDIPYENGELEDSIKAYVKSEIAKACKSSTDASLAEMLRTTEPIPLSAEMALLSYLPLSRIEAEEKYRYAWRRHCDNFEVSTQAEMYERSLFANLTRRVQEVVSKEKEEILLAKPRNAIRAAMNQAKASLDSQILVTSEKIKSLSLPDYELEEKLREVSKATQRAKKKIAEGIADTSEALETLRSNCQTKLEDLIDETCKQARACIKEKGEGVLNHYRTGFHEKVVRMIEELFQRKIPRALRELNRQKETKIKSSVNEILRTLEQVIEKYLPEIDSTSVMKSLKQSLLKSESTEDAESSINTDESANSSWIMDALELLVLPFTLVGRLVGGNYELINDAKAMINEVQNIDCEELLAKSIDIAYLEEALNRTLLVELLNPMEENLQHILDNKGRREEERKLAEEQLLQLKEQGHLLEEQIATVHL